MRQKLWKSFLALADSPNVNQDIGTMLTAIRLLVWFTVLNVALCATLVIGIAIAASEGSEAIGKMGFGQYSAILVLMALMMILTVFVPIRTAGMFHSPQMGRYLDQIVLSGITPMRYMFGRIVGVNLLFGLMTAATLPYLVFSFSLGGMDLIYLIRGVVALWCYSNMICLVTMAGATMTNEILNTLRMILLFLFFSYLSMMPYIQGAGLSPMRLILDPFFQEFGSSTAKQMYTIVWRIGGMTIEIGPSTIFFLCQPLWIGLTLLYLLLGPLHCIGLPNSTFGAVVMPGDNKRRSLFRRHRALLRRSALCFFYENRPEWLAKYEIALRWGGLLVSLMLAAGIPLFCMHFFSKQLEAKPFVIMSVVAVALFTSLAAFMFSGDLLTEKTEVRLGRITATAGAVDTVAFVFFATLLILFAFGLPQIRYWISGTDWLDNACDEHLLPRIIWLAPTLWLATMTFYGIFRWISMTRLSRAVSAVLAQFAMAGFILLPYVPHLIFSAMAETGADVSQSLRSFAGFCTYVSPLSLAVSVVDLMRGERISEYITMHSSVGLVMTILVYAVAATVCCFFAYRRHQNLNPWDNKQVQ